jgi:UDP-N-acetylglucosamine/UDP-N-acetylgalactosamine diphosphorylase
LKGGYFSGATFLDGASMGSSAHVRAGTLLEEQANGAHAVGLKQTLFLSFVTAGSLINFCDALVAGGTSRKNHSEIGSSYIHFNFTPHQDKATPSLIGDVPRGVMLDQEPIFLGGQGGLVGPVRINYGTVIPAGVICRQDILQENSLYAPPPEATSSAAPRAFRVGAYRAIQRVVANNLNYVGNIHALKLWYELVRRSSMPSDPFSAACHSGALKQIDRVLKERIVRLKDLAAKMQHSIEFATRDSRLTLGPETLAQQQALASRWPEMEAKLHQGPAQDVGAHERDRFLATWQGIGQGTPHLEAIGSLSEDAKAAGTAWLNAVVDSVVGLYQNV